MPIPEVSLLLPCHQDARYVALAVRSCLAQDWPRLDILVSDDASEDGTLAEVEREVSEYTGPHQVRVRRNDRNLGVPGHLDLLVTEARGDWIVVCEGDDVAEPQRVRRLVETALERGVSLVTSDAEKVDSDGNPLGRLVGARTPSQPIRLVTLLRHVWTTGMLGATLCFHRELFDVFGPIGAERLPFAADNVLPFRASLLRGGWYLAEPLVRYRRHGANASSWRADHSAGEPEYNETGSAMQIGVMVRWMEDVAHLRTTRGDDPRLADVHGRLQAELLGRVRAWTRLRHGLLREGRRPTWVDAAEIAARGRSYELPDDPLERRGETA